MTWQCGHSSLVISSIAWQLYVFLDRTLKLLSPFYEACQVAGDLLDLNFNGLLKQIFDVVIKRILLSIVVLLFDQKLSFRS